MVPSCLSRRHSVHHEFRLRYKKSKQIFIFTILLCGGKIITRYYPSNAIPSVMICVYCTENLCKHLFPLSFVWENFTTHLSLTRFMEHLHLFSFSVWLISNTLFNQPAKSFLIWRKKSLRGSLQNQVD